MPFDPRPRTASLSTPLLASTTQTASGTTQAVVGLATTIADVPNSLTLELDVTAAGTAVGDTLDVTVQTRFDSATWVDACHFTSVLGNGGAKRYFATLNAELAQGMIANAPLTAGNTRNLLGNDWAVSWVIVSASSPSFTFSVTACPQ